jgi:hypothetical protein
LLLLPKREIITVDDDGLAGFTNIQGATIVAKYSDVELTVVGRLISGPYFQSSDTFTIINPDDDDR